MAAYYSSATVRPRREAAASPSSSSRGSSPCRDLSAAFRGQSLSAMGPLDIDFGMINADNVEQLKKINQACFPVSYNASFYVDMAKQKDEDLCKFAYWNGFAVGAICARVEAIPESQGRNRIYIMTLGVLAAYRGHNIGTRLLRSVLDHFESHRDGKMSNVDQITLHVQTSNADAMQFYKRFGFERGEIVENYYRRIDPPHCYVLRKRLR